MKLNQYQLITAGLLSLTICSGLVLISTKSYADNDSATDDVNITVPVACTMSGNIATGQEHTASLSPGTYSAASGSDYENGIGTTTLTTFCNDNNGFSVYAIGFTGDTAGNNTLVGTSASNNATISTDTYTPGDTTSSWSMKVDKVTDTTTSYNPANMTIDNSFDNYHAVPSEYTRVAHYQASTGSSTTDTTLGAKLTTTYAAFISQTQPADTYQGQVKYTTVHPYMQDDSNKPVAVTPLPAEPGKIVYHKLASDAVGTMANQSKDINDENITDGATAKLFASNYSRSGYGFAGWNDRPDYSGNFYGPTEVITVPSGTEEDGLSLYAVWVPSAGSLQNSTTVTQVCENLTQASVSSNNTLASVSALTDQRDNQTYAIAKLADGKCWMIENLRLDAEYTRGSTNEALAEGYGGVFAGLADAENGEYTFNGPNEEANSLYSTDGANGTIAISGYDQGNRFPRYSNSNTTNRANNYSGSYSENVYSAGNYYTWAAAMANTDYLSDTVSSESAGTSICPRGWTLPTAGATLKDYNQLEVALGGDGSGYSRDPELLANFFKYPTNFNGSRDYWWSKSKANNESMGGTMYVEFSGYFEMLNINGDSNYDGNHIRCLVDS